MGLLQRRCVFLCFIFVAHFLPSFAEGEKYCWEADRDTGLCCTCTNHTLRCNDTCPPNYYLTYVSEPCRPQPIKSADNDVSTTSEPPSNVSAYSHSVSTDVQADLQVPYTVCMLCDEACSGCTGSGPAKCNSCAKEYDSTNNPLGKCIQKTESNENGLNVGLVVGVSVGGVVLIVTMLVILLLCRLHQRRLHKRDPMEPTLGRDGPALHYAARKDMVEEENILTVRPKNTKSVYKNVPEMQGTQSTEQDHETSDRYIKDPTAMKQNQAKKITYSETEEESDMPYDSVHIPPTFLQQSNKRYSSDDNIQTDGEGVYMNTAFNDANPSLSKSAERGSQRLSESAVYAHNIDGATKGPNDIENRKEETKTRDSGMGASVCADSLHKNLTLPTSKKPMFSMSWHFYNNFSADGGVLQGPKSDVSLEIPKGAILRRTNVTIYGAVCTDLARVHSYLSLPENEPIVSPVVEYCAASSKFQSQVPMCITLPHFINRPVSPESMKVYCFRRRIYFAGFHVEPLSFVEKGDLKKAVANKTFTESAGVYHFDNKTIYIWTAHFSGYACIDCGHEFKPPDIHAEVRTKYTSASRLMEVRLNLWDSRFRINDFKQNRPDKDSASLAGMVLRDVKTLLPLREGEDVKAIALGTRLTLAEENAQMWVHKKFNGKPIYPPESANIRVTTLVPCDCSGRMRFPQRVDWQLTKAVSSAAAAADDDDDSVRPLECMVEVGYIKCSEDEDVPTPLRFMPRPDPVNIPLSVMPVESATVANVTPPTSPVVNIQSAELISFAVNNQRDQSPRLRQKPTPKNPAARASSHVYQNLEGFPDRPPIPDSRDIERGNT